MGSNRTQATDAAVKRAHTSGNIVGEIAERLGCSRTTVTRSLKRQGLEPHPEVQLRGPRRKSFRAVAREVRHG